MVLQKNADNSLIINTRKRQKVVIFVCERSMRRENLKHVVITEQIYGKREEGNKRILLTAVCHRLKGISTRIATCC